ncbi:MAG: SIS domain-containing protein, partial [Fimbriimonadaceae bacterium]|nr:SIS domain-containing protein [Fimbriimonadaceae bacterium]
MANPRGRHMEREMAQQPELLAARAPEYLARLKEALQGRSFDMVLLAARGSSDNAALYCRYLIEIHLGIPVCLAAPSVLTRYGRRVAYRNCLAVGISQSGAAPDVAEVLESIKGREGCLTVGITNTPGSRLAESPDVSLLLDAGEEQSIAATKTYSLSLLALYQLTSALGADLPAADAASLPGEAWYERCREEAEAGLGPILRCEPLFSLARGYSFCTAHEAALKLMECALIPAKAYSSADFAHGPKALLDSRTAALCFTDP